MSKNIYSTTIEAKDGLVIPQLYNGKTIDSRYNPAAETERNYGSIQNENYFIVLGVGAGLLIKKILQNKPASFILAVENSQEDIEFLKRNLFIEEKQNVKAVTLETFSETFINTYIPAFYGEYKVFENRAWCNENPEAAVIFKTLLDKSLKIISADYSAQCHFGKIWTKNIFCNLKYVSQCAKKINISKPNKAAVFAAGPTLDRTISLVNPQDTTIIATDTAFPVLIKNNIIPDFVVSLDGQFISSEHFRIHTVDFNKITFVMDLSCNSSTVNFILNHKGNIIFSTSQNPLSKLVENTFTESFINLCSGTGTVTISALDFAVSAGFENIEIYGADFAYNNGKSYTSGTYLDTLYAINSSKIKSSEKTFDKLLFRTELIKLEDKKNTSSVLDSYRIGLEYYLKNKNILFSKKDDIYILNSKSEITIPLSFNTDKDYISFKNQFLHNISRNFKEKNSIFDLSSEEISLLPLISWLRKSDTKVRSFNEYLKLAIDFIQDI